MDWFHMLQPASAAAVPAYGGLARAVAEGEPLPVRAALAVGVGVAEAEADAVRVPGADAEEEADGRVLRRRPTHNSGRACPSHATARMPTMHTHTLARAASARTRQSTTRAPTVSATSSPSPGTKLNELAE
jgi:hypothetical protein